MKPSIITAQPTACYAVRLQLGLRWPKAFVATMVVHLLISLWGMRFMKHGFFPDMETLGDHLEAQTLWQQTFAAQVEARCQLYPSHVKYLKAAGRLSSSYQ